MPLKLKLKPNERIILGNTLIVNGDNLAHFTVQNRVPILREKDILSQKEADTHCKQIYFLLQVMYLENKRTKEQYDAYLKLVKDLLTAAPSLVELIYTISENLLDDNYYPALKAARQLIDREADILNSPLN